MRVTLVYLYVAKPTNNFSPPPVSFYEEYAVRFAWTYKKIQHGHDHELLVCSCGAEPDSICHELFDPLGARYTTYTGGGWDLGAYQYVASQLDCDFMVNIATPVKLIMDGWLKEMVEARALYGDGLYGPQVSFQYRPHMRTGSFACNPATLRDYPWPITDRQDAVYFECGGGYRPDRCFTNWVVEQGLPSVCVTKHGLYPNEIWSKIQNGFRQGDQSNLILWDRHNTIYRDSRPEEQLRLNAEAYPSV
jgi:hypothetical protein